MCPPLVFVDDDEDDLYLYENACTANKIKNPVITVNGGVHLLKTLESLHTLPAAILLDLNMPVKDGFEVLGELKSSLTYSDLPVIILSTATDRVSIDKAYKLGANSYLAKPSAHTEILKLISLVRDYWLNTNKRPFD